MGNWGYFTPISGVYGTILITPRGAHFVSTCSFAPHFSYGTMVINVSFVHLLITKSQPKESFNCWFNVSDWLMWSSPKKLEVSSGEALHIVGPLRIQWFGDILIRTFQKLKKHCRSQTAKEVSRYDMLSPIIYRFRREQFSELVILEIHPFYTAPWFWPNNNISPTWISLK